MPSLFSRLPHTSPSLLLVSVLTVNTVIILITKNVIFFSFSTLLAFWLAAGKFHLLNEMKWRKQMNCRSSSQIKTAKQWLNYFIFSFALQLLYSFPANSGNQWLAIGGNVGYAAAWRPFRNVLRAAKAKQIYIFCFIWPIHPFNSSNSETNQQIKIIACFLHLAGMEWNGMKPNACGSITAIRKPKANLLSWFAGMAGAETSKHKTIHSFLFVFAVPQFKQWLHAINAWRQPNARMAKWWMKKRNIKMVAFVHCWHSFHSLLCQFRKFKFADWLHPFMKFHLSQWTCNSCSSIYLIIVTMKYINTTPIWSKST